MRSGDFTVTDVGLTLQCMHAAINQAPLWTRDMSRHELEHTMAALTDTLMRLFLDGPPSPATA